MEGNNSFSNVLVSPLYQHWPVVALSFLIYINHLTPIILIHPYRLPFRGIGPNYVVKLGFDTNLLSTHGYIELASKNRRVREVCPRALKPFSDSKIHRIS